MATTFLTKSDLTKRSKQTNKLDKLIEQLKANAEFNKISEVSFEEAMKRQYKPIVETIDKKLEPLVTIDKKLEPLLAIEGAKKEAMSNETQGSVSEDERIASFIKQRLSESSFSVSERKYILQADSGKIFLNGSPVEIRNGYYIMHDETSYPATVGLTMLLTASSKSNKDANVTEEDIISYLHMLRDSRIDMDKISGNDSRYKYLNKYGISKYEKDWYIGSKMVLAKKEVSGDGVKILPSNSLSLYNMLNLRLAAYKAGNKGLRNEVIAIADELLRQDAIKPIDYKKIANIVENAGAKTRKKS